MAMISPSLDTRLLILGEGPERATLEALIAEMALADRVQLAGFVERARLPRTHFASRNVVALGGLPMILIEALLQRVPTIATDCPSGPSAILDNGRFGRLVAVQDPSALASAISAALADPLPAAGLAQRAALYQRPESRRLH